MKQQSSVEYSRAPIVAKFSKIDQTEFGIIFAWHTALVGGSGGMLSQKKFELLRVFLRPSETTVTTRNLLFS